MALDQAVPEGAAQSQNAHRELLLDGLFSAAALQSAEKQNTFAQTDPGDAASLKLASAELRNPQIAVFDLNQLDPVTQQKLASAKGPALIEFIDRNDNSSECRAAPEAFAQAASKLEGQVTFINAFTDQQDPEMLAQTRVSVCPTYFFVLDRHNPNEMVAKRIWGYLGAEQLESVSQEMWKTKPKK